MTTTTKQAAIDILKAIGQLIIQSPEAQIQEIVNQVGQQLTQMLQVDQQQGEQITTLESRASTIENDVETIQQQLSELVNLGPEETQRVLELIAENHPEIAQIELPTVTYRGQDYTLKAFTDMIAMQQGKKPVAYAEATYTPEGHLSSVLVRYDDNSQETVTLTHTITSDGKTAIYIGSLPEAGGAIDAFEWHVTVSRIQSSILGLNVVRHSDMTLMRLIGTSHLINWGNSGSPDPGDSGSGDPGDGGSPDPGDSGSPDPGDSGSGDPGDGGNPDPGDGGSTPLLQNDASLSALDGGFLHQEAHQLDALGHGFANISVPNTGIYRVTVYNAPINASYTVRNAGDLLGSLTTNGQGEAMGVATLQAGDVVSVTGDAATVPFAVRVTELDQGLTTQLITDTSGYTARAGGYTTSGAASNDFQNTRSDFDVSLGSGGYYRIFLSGLPIEADLTVRFASANIGTIRTNASGNADVIFAAATDGGLSVRFPFPDVAFSYSVVEQIAA